MISTCFADIKMMAFGYEKPDPSNYKQEHAQANKYVQVQHSKEKGIYLSRLMHKYLCNYSNN